MKHKIWKIAWFFSLTALAAAFLFLKTKNCLDSDEGIILGGAWRLYNGEKIYLDFFEYLPPASFYLVYGFWKLVGPSYLAASFLAILNLAAVLAAIHLIAKNVGMGRFSVFPPLLFLIFSIHWPLIGHNTFVLAPLAWSAYFFLRFLKNNSLKYLISSGALAGLTGLFLQHRFLALVLAVIACLFIFYRNNFKKALKAIAVYGLAAFLPLSLFFFWPLGVLYQDIMVIPWSNYLGISSVGLFWLLVPLGFLILIFLFYGRKRTKEEDFLFILQFFLLLSVAMRPDAFHVFSVIFPLLILSLSFSLKGLSEKHSQGLKIFSTSFLALSIFSLSIVLEDVDSSRQEFFYLAKEACAASQYIYSGPFAPGLYFELGKKNPSRYDSLLPGFNTPEQLAEALADISRRQPGCAILSPELMVGMTLSQSDQVKDYILSHYDQVSAAGKFKIYKPKMIR